MVIGSNAIVGPNAQVGAWARRAAWGLGSQNCGIAGAVGWPGSSPGSSAGSVPFEPGIALPVGTGGSVVADGTNGDRSTSS